MNKCYQGMTLVEMMVATAILSVMMVFMLMFMQGMIRGTAYEFQATKIEADGNKVINDMAELLVASWVVPAWNANIWGTGDDTIVFLVPVDHDGDKDVTDNNVNVQWGSIRQDYSPGQFLDLTHTAPSSTQNFRTTYTFVANPELEFNEATRVYDLNRDGDKNDIFDIGHIEVSYPQGVSSAANATHPSTTLPAVAGKTICPDIIVRKKGQSSADIDELAVDTDPNSPNDPLFWQVGSRLYITIYVTKPDEKEPVFFKLATSVELRNDGM